MRSGVRLSAVPVAPVADGTERQESPEWPASHARHRLDHARHLLARHPGDAGRGRAEDRRARVRG